MDRSRQTIKECKKKSINYSLIEKWLPLISAKNDERMLKTESNKLWLDIFIGNSAANSALVKKQKMDNGRNMISFSTYRFFALNDRSDPNVNC